MTLDIKFQDSNQWKWIFIIAAIIYGTGAVTFWFMSTGEVQEWAKDQPDVESVLTNKSIDSLETDFTKDEKQLDEKKD